MELEINLSNDDICEIIKENMVEKLERKNATVFLGVDSNGSNAKAVIHCKALIGKRIANLSETITGEEIKTMIMRECQSEAYTDMKVYFQTYTYDDEPGLRGAKVTATRKDDYSFVRKLNK